MKLEYNILWIEDKPDTVVEFQEALEILLADNGFKMRIEPRQEFVDGDIDALKAQLEKYNPYDFIIFDYDLGTKSANGLKVAKELRSSIYTDMIFYSAKPSKDLRTLLYEDKVDGVFIVRRPNFNEDLIPIVEDHIKRISDINNMRGLVLDEVSQCDAMMRELLQTQWESLEQCDKDKQFSKIRDAVAKQLTDCLETVNGDNLTFNQLVSDHRLSDFGKVRMRLCGVLKKLKSPYTGDINDNSPLKNIQDLRNDFAHKRATYDENKAVIGTQEFDQKRFEEIRKDLLNIDDILGKLGS